MQKPVPQPDRVAARAVVVAGVLGALGVALGAFGAHGLKDSLASAVDGAQRMAWWQTAAQYQLVHALLAGILGARASSSPRAARGVWLCVAGVVLFSGSLYAMTLTNLRILGAITPLGGLSFIAAWLALASSASGSSAGSSASSSKPEHEA